MLVLSVLPERLAILRLPPDTPFQVPDAKRSPFWSATRTSDELSIVCAENAVPDGAAVEPGWRAFKVHGPFDFNLTGILSSIATPLAMAGVSIFAISTFDTDYVLVREHQLPVAIDALRRAGHECQM